MKNRIIILIMLCGGLPASAQNYQLLFTIPCHSGDFTTDPIGNCYIFSKGDVSRFNGDGFETARYSTREYGDITYVDATNPLKVLVVFREFSTAVVLDASLSLQATIHLRFDEVPYVKIICTSKESGYWIVDPVSKVIRKMSDQLNFDFEGTAFRQVTSSDIEPTYLIDSGNWLMMNTRGYGLLIFDRFATYYKSIPDFPDVPYQATGHEVLYKDKDGMMKMDIRTGQTDHFILPANLSTDPCRVEGNRIFLKSDDSLKIYSY